MTLEMAPDTNTTAAMEINLMPYINALISARWRILLAVVIAGIIAAWFAYSSPVVFESVSRVSIVDIEDPGGVSPDDRRASEVLTLVEHGFVMGTTRDNYLEVMRARLGSREFTMHFLDTFNVYRHFYPNHWDSETQRWAEGFEPDRGASYTRFRDQIRTIEHDEETQIIAIRMRWTDPSLARDWANQYVSLFNDFIRNRVLIEVDRKQDFLKGELQRSDLMEIERSIYRLIEAQTAIAMLANARQDYALEVIDPAAMPYASFSLSPKRQIAIGMITAAMLACFFTLFIVLFKRLRENLVSYRDQYLSTIDSAGLNP